nr:hypothetical protein [Tanacetum cinerariifolium]
GFLDNFYESVKASKPKTLDETIELANDLMDQKLRTYVERQTNNKRKADDSSRSNHGYQQHPSKGRMSPRIKKTKKRTKSDQNRTKTGSVAKPRKFKAVSIERGRKTKENKK